MSERESRSSSGGEDLPDLSMPPAGADGASSHEKTAPATTVDVKQARQQTAAYSVGFVILGMAVASLGPAMLALGRQIGVDDVAPLAGIFVARSFGYLVGSVAGGPLFDKMNGNRVLAASVAFTSVGLFCIPFVRVLWLLVGLYFTTGISMGILDTGANVSIIWLWGTKSGPYMQTMHFSFGVGAIIGPLLVGAVLKGQDGRADWAFFTIAACAALLVPWLMTFPRPDVAHGRSKTKLATPEILVVALCSFLLLVYVGAEVCAGGFLPVFAVKKGFTDEPTAATVAAVFWFMLTLGRMIAIPLSMKVSNRNMLFVNLVGCIVTLCFWWIFESSEVVMWTAAAIYGLFMSWTFPTVITYAEELIDLTGKLTTLLVVGAAVGEMIIPMSIAGAVDKDPVWLIRVVLICGFFGAISFAVLVFAVAPRTRKQQTGKDGVQWAVLEDESDDSFQE